MINHTIFRAQRHPSRGANSRFWRLVAEGATDGEIALKLEISPGTVAWHVKAIRTRLDARSRTHAAALALRQDLLPGRRSRDQPT